MPSFRHTIDIAGTPEQVWDDLGDLTCFDRPTPGAAAARCTDSGRACTFKDGHVQSEQILDYSPQPRSYRYVIDRAPLPVRDNIGTFTVEDADGQARVIWESSFVALSPAQAAQLAEMWEPYLPTVLANLKKLVEDQ